MQTALCPVFFLYGQMESIILLLSGSSTVDCISQYDNWLVQQRPLSLTILPFLRCELP